MNRNVVIERLKQNETALHQLGLCHVSLFGSMARGNQRTGSDVDLAVIFEESANIDLFRFAAINEHLCRMLETKVDMVVEPARNARMQAEIDRDRLRVF